MNGKGVREAWRPGGPCGSTDGPDWHLERFSSDDPSALRDCPYCGARAMRLEEELLGAGVLEETFWVCFACGQSISSPRWTGASTRRAFLLALRKVGPYLLIAAAAWVLKPYLPFLPRRTFARAGGT